jgi:RHS repeat-associated protein
LQQRATRDADKGCGRIRINERFGLAVAAGVTTYFHSDHLSWRVSTNTAGQIVGQQATFPFGESWYSSSGNEFVFTSYQRDAESGLDYAMARYYDSTVGRFCSADPLGGHPDNPQTWNRYAYVGNDPVNLTDPSGRGWLNWLELAASLLADAFTAGATTPETADLTATLLGIQQETAAIATIGAITQVGDQANQKGQQGTGQPLPPLAAQTTQTPAGYRPCPPVLFRIKAPRPGQATSKGGAAGVPNVKSPGNVAYNPADFGLGTADAHALDRSATPILFQPDWSTAQIPMNGGGYMTPAPNRGYPQTPNGLPVSTDATLKGRDTLGGVGGSGNPPNTIDMYGYTRRRNAQQATRDVMTTVYIPNNSNATCPKGTQ